MTYEAESRSEFDDLPASERKKLFLDVLKTPPFSTPGTWGEWFHAWLEDQAAEGRSLAEIAQRLDLPRYDDGHGIEDESWELLDRHVVWMIDRGYARVVLIRVVS